MSLIDRVKKAFGKEEAPKLSAEEQKVKDDRERQLKKIYDKELFEQKKLQMKKKAEMDAKKVTEKKEETGGMFSPPDFDTLLYGKKK